MENKEKDYKDLTIVDYLYKAEVNKVRELPILSICKNGKDNNNDDIIEIEYCENYRRRETTQKLRKINIFPNLKEALAQRLVLIKINIQNKSKQMELATEEYRKSMNTLINMEKTIVYFKDDELEK